MGAFFICKKDNVDHVKPAFVLFSEMGFTSPTSIEVGEWVLFAYPKMATAAFNIASDHDSRLVSVGTPIYRGLDYSGSLAALIKDFLSGSIDTEQLVGQYTLLFCRGDTIEILCDPLRSKHLFTDIDHRMLSSHMLPISQCLDGDLHVNRNAVYEKFLTGIIMPPNTLFEEIVQIDKSVEEDITREGTGIQFTRIMPLCVSRSGATTFKECLVEQADALRNYFEMLDAAGRDGTDIGLSGGYDSRLGLACLNQYTRVKMHLHSHATEDVHQKDLMIAKQMADHVGVPCHTVPTRKLSHCDHVDDILRKSILYFDGRSSFSIGGCGEVYTASYRRESTEGTPFSLTGVGGELYRNVFDIGFRSIRFDRFMEDKVFSQCFRRAIPESLYQELKDDIINRAAARLGIDQRGRQSKAVAHRYYCEIMMPDGQGVALDAYNQVSCCVAPFMEPRIISKGYEAIPFHHSGGEFEGKLIGYIDPGLAEIPSSYGYPIASRSMKAKIKESLRTYIPTFLWGKFSTVMNSQHKGCSSSEITNELYVNSKTMKEAFSYMIRLFPEVSFFDYLQTGEDIRRTQFISMTLFMLRERIKNK